MKQEERMEENKKKEQDKTEELITNDDDFVIFNNGGQILGGGFHVNSLLLKHKQSPMHTLNQKYHGGGSLNVSNLYDYLAIPAGIFYEPNKLGGKRDERNGQNKVLEEEDVDEDVYDKLVKLASVESDNKFNQKKERKKSRKQNSPIKLNDEHKKIAKKRTKKLYSKLTK